MKTVYIGYDPRESLAYQVAESSLRKRTKEVNVRPIALHNPDVSSILTRPIERVNGKLWCPISQAPMSVEFAISRFCVPFIHKTGWCLFVDCDVLFLADVEELFQLADERYAVMVVKHNYRPSSATKMDGQIQTSYDRKLWSSVMLWNCDHPANQNLTLRKLNEWPGRDLHGLRWLDDDLIGELPREWNHLVGIDTPDKWPVKLAHYTLGGPWLTGIKDTFWDRLWLREFAGEPVYAEA